MKKKIIRNILFFTMISSMGLPGMVRGQEENIEYGNSCAEHIVQCQNQKSETMAACQQDHNSAACDGDSECIQNIEEDRRLCQNDANELYKECVAECQE